MSFSPDMQRSAKGDDDMPKLRGLGPLIAPHADVPAKNKRHRPGATEMARLTLDEADRQRKRVTDNAPKGVDLSHEGIVQRLMEMHGHYDKNFHDDYHSGGDFYHHANKLARNLGNSHGLSQRTTTGVIAGLSPGTDWDRNVTQAMHLIANHKDYDHLPPEEAAKAYHATVGTGNEHGVVRNTVDNYTKAFHILRGGDPSDHLGGHKVRSFFNNILDPNNKGGVNSVTMDRHAISAAVGGTVSAKRLDSVFYDGSSAENNTKGTYAHFADAYRDAHARLTEAGHDAGATPAHFQAKIWGVWRNQAKDNAKKTPEKRLVPHYAAKHDDKDNDGFFGGLIDPWGGPEGEPDPDLRPRQNAAYWRKRRKHEQQQHPLGYGYGYPWFLGDYDDDDHDSDEDDETGSDSDDSMAGGDADDSATAGGDDGGGMSTSAAFNPSRGLLHGVVTGARRSHESPSIDDPVKEGYGLDDEDDASPVPHVSQMRVSPDEMIFEASTTDPYADDYFPHDPYGIMPKKKWVKPTDRYRSLEDLHRGTQPLPLDFPSSSDSQAPARRDDAVHEYDLDPDDVEGTRQQQADAYFRYHRHKLNSLQRLGADCWVCDHRIRPGEEHSNGAHLYCQNKLVEGETVPTGSEGFDRDRPFDPENYPVGVAAPVHEMYTEESRAPYDTAHDLWQHSRPMPSRVHLPLHKLNAINSADEIPPAPGTVPIPEGHVRLFHYTPTSALPSIREHGLQVSHAKGETYGEPNQIWAAAGVPREDGFHSHNYVEFHADPSKGKDLNIGEHWGHGSLDDHIKHLEGNRSHVTMRGDVPPENIVAIHEPWHTGYHYLKKDHAEEVKRGEYDWVHDDPGTEAQYGKAIRRIKAEGRLVPSNREQGGAGDRRPLLGRQVGAQARVPGAPSQGRAGSPRDVHDRRGGVPARAGRRGLTRWAAAGTPHTVSVHKDAREGYAALSDPGLKKLVRKHVNSLKHDPEPQSSSPKKGPLSGYRAIEFSHPGGAYRILYKTQGTDTPGRRHSTVYSVGAHENFYDQAIRRKDSWEKESSLMFGGLAMYATYEESAEGDPTPSPWWQDQHSTAAPNPASTGPVGFGNQLDPEGDQWSDMMGQPEMDEKLLAPGPAISGMNMGPGWTFDSTASLHTAAICRHCEREITHEHGQWVDPEAKGDDAVWRETCDSNHESLAAEHEPKERNGGGDRPHLQLAAGLDGESSYYSYIRVPCHNCGGQGFDPSNKQPCAHCGGQGYVLGMGDERYEDRWPHTAGEVHNVQTHSADGDYSDRQAAKYQVRCRTCGYTSPHMPFYEAIEDHRSHERNANLPQRGGFDPSQTVPHRLPMLPKSDELSDGRRPHPRTVQDESKMDDWGRPTQYDADFDFERSPQKLNSLQTAQPAPDPRAWLLSGSSGHTGASGATPAAASDSDIAKQAKAHLAALSLAEQQDLIKEGEAEGVRARNYDLLRLEGTHYVLLEQKLSAEERGENVDEEGDDDGLFY